MPRSPDARQKRKAVYAEIMGGSCNRCNYSDCLAALDFHHIDETNKSFSISQVWKPFNEVIQELEKCILLCCRCHRELHDNFWSLSEIKIKPIDYSLIDSKFSHLKNRGKRDNENCKFCGKKLSGRKDKQFCNENCHNLYQRKTDRPSKKKLISLRKHNTWKQIGETYNVSESCVRKWAKQYEI